MPVPKYGIEFNEERKRVGLPILDSNWRHLSGKMVDETGRRVFYTTWVNPARRETNKSYHFARSIRYNNDTIFSESNQYTGSRRFATLDGTSTETLFITYFFVDSRWRYSFLGEKIPDLENYSSSDGRIYSSSKIFVLTKEEADSVLKHWNIDRELKL
jgi:hypothetical protein